MWFEPDPDKPIRISGQGDYGYNSRGTASSGPSLGLDVSSSNPSGVNEAAVLAPSDMTAIGDSPHAGFWIGPKLFANTANFKHEIGVNHAFCDGHVEYGKTNRVYGANPEVRRRWNRDNQPHPETW